jgi:hypothetical protein
VLPIAPPRKYSDKILIVTALPIDEPFIADPPPAVPVPPAAVAEAAPARGGGKPARRGGST